MGVLINLPKVLKIGASISKYKQTGKELDRLHEAGECVKEREILAAATKEWTGELMDYLGIELEVRGAENIPEEDGFVVVANHQGYADIVVTLAAMDGKHQIGFGGKDNLVKIPFIGQWVVRLRGVFSPRGNARESLKVIKEGVKLVKNGFNVAIFPEGTRARCSKPGEFKPGAFKLATMAKAKILPISINGSYHLYEETGKLRPCKIKMQIHPPVETAGKSKPELAEIERNIAKTVVDGVAELASEMPGSIYEKANKK